MDESKALQTTSGGAAVRAVVAWRTWGRECVRVIKMLGRTDRRQSSEGGMKVLHILFR